MFSVHLLKVKPNALNVLVDCTSILLKFFWVNRYVSGGPYLHFFKILLGNSFSFWWIVPPLIFFSLVFVNLFITDKTLFVNNKIRKK